MKRTLQEIAQELRACAELLSEAVNRRELATVESLLERRGALLVEMSCIEVPIDDEARRAIASVRDLDALAGQGLTAMRDEVVEELGNVRGARRAGRDKQSRPRPSAFVSTRC